MDSRSSEDRTKLLPVPGVNYKRMPGHEASFSRLPPGAVPEKHTRVPTRKACSPPAAGGGLNTRVLEHKGRSLKSPPGGAPEILVVHEPHSTVKRKRRDMVQVRIQINKDALQRILKHASEPISDLFRQLHISARKKDPGSSHRAETPDITTNLNGQRIEVLETDQPSLLENLSYWKDQFHRATAVSNSMASDIFKLQSSLDIQSENELIEQFRELCYNIRNSCDHFSHESAFGEHTLSKSCAVRFLTLLDLDPEIDHQFLTTLSKRAQLSQAYISRMLVDRIFDSGIDDIGQIKDLWTSESTARGLAEMERKIKEINLPPEEFNKWRSMTVRCLTQETLGDNVRVEELVDELLQMLQAIFGVTGDLSTASVAKLRMRLKSDVVIKAVNLSRSFRRQLSRMSACIDGSSARFVSSEFDEYGKVECSENEIMLVTTPAMVRFTDEYGTKDTEANVMLRSRRVRLQRKVITATKGHGHRDSTRGRGP